MYAIVHDSHSFVLLPCVLSRFMPRVPGDVEGDHHPVTRSQLSAQLREFAALQNERLSEMEIALDAKKDKRKG